MSAAMKIKTQCPVCKARFRVPARAVRHRARCSKCGAVFRVVEVKRPRVPTEEDIVQWLNEDLEEGDAPVSPRILSGGRDQARVPVDQPAGLAATPGVDHPAPPDPPDRLPQPQPEPPIQTLELRKTG